MLDQRQLRMLTDKVANAKEKNKEKAKEKSKEERVKEKVKGGK
jgi:hypothetical protein